jgi:hypothetical protein
MIMNGMQVPDSWHQVAKDCCQQKRAIEPDAVWRSGSTTRARRPRSVGLPVVADFISLPFYDLFHENGHVPKIRKNLPPLLSGVRRSILEIGAGTGLITASLADWTPAEIFALEPSAGMRGILP